MEKHGEDNALAEASADFCDLNVICEVIARPGAEVPELPCSEDCPAVAKGIIVRLIHPPKGKFCECGVKLRKAAGMKDVLICPKCERLYSSPTGDPGRWAVSARGMANFVGKAIANDFAQPAGEVYHLGEIRQRDIYFAVRPPSQFFKSHNDKMVVLIVGNSGAEIPDGWKGQIAYFNELFYYHDNELRIAPNIYDKILPSRTGGLRRGKYRVIHERRDQWLRFIVWLLSRPYDPKNFYKGVIRQSFVCEWFVRNIPGAPSHPRTYKRDREQFRTYQGKPGERDFRESAIILLLKQAADPKFVRRLETAQATADLLLQLKDGETKCGHPIEISSKWQYDGDKRGTRTLVAVANTPDPGDLMDMQEEEEGK